MVGREISNVQTIASGRGIREVTRLVRKYGGKAKNWRKMKGSAELETRSGSTRRAEIHWYEAHGVGRVEYKRKRWLD